MRPINIETLIHESEREKEKEEKRRQEARELKQVG